MISGPRSTWAQALWLPVAVVLLAAPTQAEAAPIDDKIQLLRNRPTGMTEDDWRKKRRDVARELGDARSKAAIDALIEVVETERYDAVLSISMDSLARQGDSRAIPALQKVYADRSIDSFIREEAARAIRTLGGTPQDDARLVGGAVGPAGSGSGGLLEGPQLGAMGAASAPEDQFDPSKRKPPLPDNLRARELELGFVFGSLDLQVNTKVEDQPIIADAGLGAFARYIDERHQWGWTLGAGLDAGLQNGDAANIPAGNGDDVGDTLFIGERLDIVADAHYYFGKSDFHAFAEAGISQRLTHISVDDIGGNESSLSDTRFAIDIVPGAGLGWGRYLNAGSDIMLDALVDALEDENILARDLDEPTRKEIRDAVFRWSNSFSSYPRVALVLQILQKNGYLARNPGARVIHRVRSIVESPAYLNRPRGIRARAGFLYGLPINQNDYFRRQGSNTGDSLGDSVGAPFVQFEAGFQLAPKHQILADTRFYYDVIDQNNLTTDSGITYTRFFHSDYDDYRGQWFAGIRGGISSREFPDIDAAGQDVLLGYRAMGLAGYAFGFRRGSEVSAAVNAGIDSGAFLLGVGLTFRFGIFRGSVLNPQAGGGSGLGGKARAKGGSVEAGAEAGESE